MAHSICVKIFFFQTLPNATKHAFSYFKIYIPSDCSLSDHKIPSLQIKTCRKDKTGVPFEYLQITDLRALKLSRRTYNIVCI